MYFVIIRDKNQQKRRNRIKMARWLCRESCIRFICLNVYRLCCMLLLQLIVELCLSCFHFEMSPFCKILKKLTIPFRPFLSMYVFFSLGLLLKKSKVKFTAHFIWFVLLIASFPKCGSMLNSFLSLLHAFWYDT